MLWGRFLNTLSGVNLALLLPPCWTCNILTFQTRKLRCRLSNVLTSPGLRGRPQLGTQACWPQPRIWPWILSLSKGLLVLFAGPREETNPLPLRALFQWKPRLQAPAERLALGQPTPQPGFPSMSLSRAKHSLILAGQHPGQQRSICPPCKSFKSFKVPACTLNDWIRQVFHCVLPSPLAPLASMF